MSAVTPLCVYGDVVACDRPAFGFTERLVTLLPSVELVVIVRTGHLPHEERPDAFMAAIVDWVATTR